MHLNVLVRWLLSCLRFGGGSRFNNHLGFPWTLLGNYMILPKIRSQPLPHYLKCILH
jgi:hypothetical protein